MHVVSGETVNRSKIVINLHIKLVLKENEEGTGNRGNGKSGYEVVMENNNKKFKLTHAPSSCLAE